MTFCFWLISLLLALLLSPANRHPALFVESVRMDRLRKVCDKHACFRFRVFEDGLVRFIHHSFVCLFGWMDGCMYGCLPSVQNHQDALDISAASEWDLHRREKGMLSKVRLIPAPRFLF